MDARWLGSPNYTPGRGTYTVQCIVIHTMVGTVASADARFQQSSQQASAHYGVGLDGSLVQWVAEKDTAYHAGDWIINERSIGIEHEDNGAYNSPRTDALYVTSSILVRDLCARYSIPLDRAHIRKHSEVSDKPTGCPDSLDIDRIIREAIGVEDMTPEEHNMLVDNHNRLQNLETWVNENHQRLINVEAFTGQDRSNGLSMRNELDAIKAKLGA